MKPLAFTAGEKGRTGPEVALMTSVLYPGAHPNNRPVIPSKARELRFMVRYRLGGTARAGVLRGGCRTLWYCSYEKAIATSRVSLRLRPRISMPIGSESAVKPAGI